MRKESSTTVTPNFKQTFPVPDKGNNQGGRAAGNEGTGITML